MTKQNVPTGQDSDNPPPNQFDILNDAHLEVSRAQTLMEMAGERMNALCSQLGTADETWLYVEDAMRTHLAKLDQLLEAAMELRDRSAP